MSKSLQERILSAGILAPLVLALIWTGGVIFNILVVITAIIMAFEWCSIIYSQEGDAEYSNKWVILGTIYISIFASSLIYLRDIDGGFGNILYLVLIVWATDIAAYFSGRYIGGPKIAVKISPNKTWAGLIGGMIAAGLVSSVASFLIDDANLILYFIIGTFLAVFAQVGDFFESWLKRKFAVKDSGSIIPGHGGVMDRVDGLVTVSALLAILALIRGGALF
ncbi:phosphatidate cytidylyltransferase [Rickettsiales bacterium]|nr:phosphatidate cytidylyltransferase [Rickettsiales bacterium]